MFLSVELIWQPADINVQNLVLNLCSVKGEPCCPVYIDTGS
jgi:hypothetical protein